MKYITFTVPCYNSQDYMERCIDSLLWGGKDVEIIIIDDGSTDRTAEIADRYATEYPGIVRVVHKKNGGHGSGVNKGMELAEGLYFKVVDSDDWLDKEAYLLLLSHIKQQMGREADMIVCNYIYDHLNEGRKQTMRYTNVFPKERICTWKEIRHFRPSQYLIMHALVYRTQILKECGLYLPENMFFVDNLFAYQPLPYVKKLCYLNIDLYHYYLGREDQSVNEKMLIKRIDQQIFVTEQVRKAVNIEETAKKYPRLAAYMKRNISIMMAISGIHLLLMNTEEARKKKNDLWNKVKQTDRKLYFYLRLRTISGLTHLPGKAGDVLTVSGYRLAKKVYQFQ